MVKMLTEWQTCNNALINPKRCVQGMGNEMFSLVKTNGTVPGQQIHVKIQVSGNRVRVYRLQQLISWFIIIKTKLQTIITQAAWQ